MKLSTNTLNLLKNFSMINEGIFIKKGNVIETISKLKNILARAEIQETFEDDFGIYDLNKFLGVISLENESPEIKFDDKCIIIETFSGRSRTNYRKASKDVLLVPPDKKINMGVPEITITLTKEEMAWINRIASMLSSPNISFVSDGEKIEVHTYDAKDDGCDVNVTQLDADPKGKKYHVIFRTENLKFVDGSYEIQNVSKGIGHFKNLNAPVEYWVMHETGSTYGE